MREVWKDIKGFEGQYQISNLGNARSLDRMVNHYGGGLRTVKGMDLKIIINKINRYSYLSLTKKSVYKGVRVHRVVATAFIPNPLNKPAVNHKNGIKSDNRVENLEWCTHKENVKHSIDTGLRDINGEKSGRAKFTNKQVQEIRDRIAKGELQKDLKVEFNVSIQTINRINKRTIYKL